MSEIHRQQKGYDQYDSHTDEEARTLQLGLHLQFVNLIERVQLVQLDTHLTVKHRVFLIIEVTEGLGSLIHQSHLQIGLTTESGHIAASIQVERLQTVAIGQHLLSLLGCKGIVHTYVIYTVLSQRRTTSLLHLLRLAYLLFSFLNSVQSGKCRSLITATGDIGREMQLRESALTLQATQDALFPLVGNIELLSIAMTLVQRLTKVVEYRREGLHLALALFQLFDTLTKHIDSLVILTHALIDHTHQLIGSSLTEVVIILLGIGQHILGFAQGRLDT